jgi:hypothetical protein
MHTNDTGVKAGLYLTPVLTPDKSTRSPLLRNTQQHFQVGKVLACELCIAIIWAVLVALDAVIIASVTTATTQHSLLTLRLVALDSSLFYPRCRTLAENVLSRRAFRATRKNKRCGRSAVTLASWTTVSRISLCISKRRRTSKANSMSLLCSATVATHAITVHVVEAQRSAHTTLHRHCGPIILRYESREQGMVTRIMSKMSMKKMPKPKIARPV